MYLWLSIAVVPVISHKILRKLLRRAKKAVITAAATSLMTGKKRPKPVKKGGITAVEISLMIARRRLKPVKKAAKTATVAAVRVTDSRAVPAE